MLEEFAGRFSGKTSPVHHFWHTFDIAHDPVRRRRRRPAAAVDPVTREAYSREVDQLGVLVRRRRFPEPAFYSYTAPEPAGLAGEPPCPRAARWVERRRQPPGGAALRRRPRRAGPDGRPCSTSGERVPGRRASEPAGTSTGTPASTVPPTRCWSRADQPRAAGGYTITARVAARSRRFIDPTMVIVGPFDPAGPRPGLGRGGHFLTAAAWSVTFPGTSPQARARDVYLGNPDLPAISVQVSHGKASALVRVVGRCR